MKFESPITVGTYIMGSSISLNFTITANAGSSTPMGLWFFSSATSVIPNDCFVTLNITSISNGLVKGIFSGNFVKLVYVQNTPTTYQIKYVNWNFEAAIT